jgi:hypothetical protein
MKKAFAVCMAALTFWATGLLGSENSLSAGPRAALAQTQMRAAGQGMVDVRLPNFVISHVFEKNFRDPNGFSVGVLGRDTVSGGSFQGTYSQSAVSAEQLRGRGSRQPARQRPQQQVGPVRVKLSISYKGITQTYTAVFVPGDPLPYDPVATTSVPGSGAVVARGANDRTVEALTRLCGSAAAEAIRLMQAKQHKGRALRNFPHPR